MSGRRPSLMAKRVARFEHVEERLVLSADAWTSLVHHGELTSPVVEETSPAIDLGGTMLRDSNDVHIAPHLGGAHASTGVSDVHADYGFYGSGQTVVVIDSGIAYDHYALGGGFGAGNRVVGGWDFAENDANPYDDAPAGFHGTHVAGIIGSDDATYMGVAPEVDLVALRVFDDAGNGNFGWVEDALDWVIANQNTFANPITTVNLSLGVPEMNYGNVPSWAAVADGLESKLQALNEAGIFVAVSAGNDFELFNAQGLSYPAVSDWVVPVSSADDAGTVMSDFSQRDDHVLVAPGESITSTVPDELFSFDGVPNDWASASGTSMASPYVAGASVLVREAYAFMGMGSVDQDAIYDALFDTASIINDPITSGAYHFIDVEAALASIITDTFADDSASATAMGMMGDGYSFGELIGRMNDRDYFAFTAAITGEISFTASATHNLDAQWELVGGGGSINGDTLSFDVVAGQSYTVGLMTSNGIGHYSVDVQLESSIVDWGVVERNAFDNVAIAGEQWYSITSTRAGMATVEANYAGGDTVALEFYNESQQLLATGTSSTGYSRVDAQVAAGQTILVKVTGNSSEVDFNVWNIVGINGQSVDVYGDAGDDSMAFAAGANHQVTINGLTYDLNVAGTSDFEFHGGGGTDDFTFTGNSGDDTATMSVGSNRVIGDGYDVRATDIGQIEFNGGGGYDTARMWDSATDDQFVAGPNTAQLTGTGFSHTVNGFDKVQAYATAGGHDTATLNDSAGDDFHVAKPTFVYLSGSGFYNYVKGFDAVEADASAGGYDRARLYDAATDDSLTISPTSAQFAGAGFDNTATAFDQVKAYAVAGGNDQAVMTDSAGNDDFITTSTYAILRGTGFYNYGLGFDQVVGQSAAGGSDRAIMYDSAGNETLTAYYNDASLSGAGFLNRALDFGEVKAYATAGGYDQAIFYDSLGDDQFSATHYYAVLQGTGFYNFARDFDYVEGHSQAGGNDEAKLYDSIHDDVLTSTPSYMSMTRTGFENRAVGFASAKGYAMYGGDDTANFLGAVTDDVLRAKDSFADIQRAAAREWAFDFENVNAYAQTDETPTLQLNPVDCVFINYGTWL